MAGFDHTPHAAEPRDPIAEEHNARMGLHLFAVYLLGYGAFVVANAFFPSAMDVVLFAGLNVAVVSGMVLIVSALVIAVLYSWLCKAPKRGES